VFLAPFNYFVFVQPQDPGGVPFWVRGLVGFFDLFPSWALQDGEVPVSFRLPEGDYTTRLVEAPARYWELEVAAVTSGLDFGAVFPVPVYAVPRS
jgi:hypothetical protein